MANYYYARVRTYVSTNNGGLSSTDLSNNKVKADPIVCADKSADGKTKKQYVWYIVDVYETTVSNFDLWKTLPYAQLGTLLLNTNNRKIEVTLPSSDTIYTTQTDVDYYTVVGAILHVEGHMEFTISNNLGKPRSMKPIIKIYQDGAGSQSWTQIASNKIWWDNTAQKQQTIKFTGAAGAPTYPSTAATNYFKDYYDGKYGAGYYKNNITITASEWGVCTNLWCYMVVDNKDATVTFWTSKENGTGYTMPKGPKPTGANILGPKRIAWNDSNAAAFKKAIDATACKDTTNTKPPAVIGNDYNVDVTPPKDAERWNPPPHRESRSVPYSVRTDLTPGGRGDMESATFANILNAANQFSNTGQYISYQNNYKFLERGKIFQDVNSASILNQANTGSKPPPPGQSNQWGFRFMYNPTNFRYETAANNSIDWTLGSKDTAALLAGNQTVSFQLYLNRVVDLSYLRTITDPKIGMSVYNQLSPTAAYGRELSEKEIEGILNRGTEYDLEFLYRCLTGDPLTNNPLLNDTLRKNGSADIGYITGIPLWLYLSDNIRYFGSITGFSVSHIIFNTEMVPTLSVVDISFSRYPAQFSNDSTTLKAVHDSFFPPANK